VNHLVKGSGLAVKGVVLAVLIADLSSSTIRAYACLTHRPGSEALHCEEPGEILPALGLKLATGLQILNGTPQPAPAGAYHPTH